MGDAPALISHVSSAPVPPSTRARQPIPPALDALVLACLAKDPADRPQSARELSRRLAELDGADDWSQERAREWWVGHVPPAGEWPAAPVEASS